MVNIIALNCYYIKIDYCCLVATMTCININIIFYTLIIILLLLLLLLLVNLIIIDRNR